MKVYFRTDASRQIGTGHVMRCLALADELKKRKAVIKFACHRLNGDLISFIRKNGYEVSTKNHLKKEDGDIDWLIVDHYGIDASWEKMMRPFVKKIMAIDDLANRHHDCDLLLDQNLYEYMEDRYKGLVPEGCRQLLGPRYALLRPEFKKVRNKVKERNGKIQRILIFFGGSDHGNGTSKALKAVQLLKRADIVVDVVIGINNPHRPAIKRLISTIARARCHSYVNNMAELMRLADLYIGAAGITMWERCCLGLPSLVISVAENQIGPVRYMAQNNYLYYLGRNTEVIHCDIKQALEYFLSQPRILKQYSQKSFRLVDGAGVERCADTITNTRL